MESTSDRRTFLRRAALAVLGAPAVYALGCTPDAPRRVARGAEPEPLLARPILLPWGADGVRIASPLAERPVAYMSTGRMEIHVDHEYRDRLQYVFGAHISVSTGHWRIRRPGDSLLQPVQPGDALREYEEIDMRRWDAILEPSEGDVRVLRGSPTGIVIDVPCVPMSGGGAWFRGGPWDLLQCGPRNEELAREDLMEIGTGTRFDDRDCTRPAGSVRFVTWACPVPTTPAGA